MKAFAIITAALMATGGAAYFYSTSTCTRSGCSLPVAKSGGCCAVKTDCCSAHEECCELQEACCFVATSAASAKVDCCAAKLDCCLVNAACCTVEKVSATAKPVDFGGCCEACVTPTLNVTLAAKSIAAAK